jgi:hypothetical protein
MLTVSQVLQKAESERWRRTTVPYNPLAVHTTVPLILYENQRLDMRLKTLALSGGKPKFSASGLGRAGRRAQFELRLPRPDEETGQREMPAWRSDVQLPLLEYPKELPPPGQAREGVERSHFWLYVVRSMHGVLSELSDVDVLHSSDWTLDITHPGVNAEEGWQYATSFQEPEESWLSEPPPQLERLLAGGGGMSVGITSPALGSARSRSTSGSADPATTQKWVRRRRWVRVMRRRLDIAPLPFLQPDGRMYHLSDDGALLPVEGVASPHSVDADGEEMGFMPPTALSAAQDYVARARYLAGTPHPDADPGTPVSPVDLRRAIVKLERATSELRQGVLRERCVRCAARIDADLLLSSGDDEAERRTQGEVLLNAYSRELERRRLAAGAQGLSLSSQGLPQVLFLASA